MALTLPIYTQRLVLRKLTVADLPHLSRYRNLPDVALYQSWEEFTRQDAEKLYAQQDALPFNSDNTWFQLAVAHQEDDRLIGDIGIHFFDEGRQAELGMTFDAGFQKQGFALEATSAIVTLLFTQFVKHRLTAVVDTRNIRAINLLEKLNFRREAHYRQNIFFKGMWGDEYLYARLASD